MSKVDVQELVIDGQTYVKKSSVQTQPTGPRCVVVVDRGWIFAGDVSVDDDTGNILISNGFQVLKWLQGGFAKLCEDPKAAKAELLKMPARVEVPPASEVFRVPVSADWGTK